jgi:hypothetical protein
VLVLGMAIVLVSWGLASRERRIAGYNVRGALNGVSLDFGDPDVVIRGAGARGSLAVSRSDRFSFGHDANAQRGVAGGVFRIRSRCPSTLFHTCAESYRLLVPDNVPVDVRTSGGDVTLEGYRGSARIATGSGRISVSGFCGFSLQASAGSGDISADTACAPQQMSLRSTSGDVSALVPPGRYRVDADSNSGRRVVRGLTAAADAVFSIQALSNSGDVLLETKR